MKKAKLILIITLLLMTISMCNAQVINSSQLANTVWINETESGNSETLEFTKDSVRISSYYPRLKDTVKYSKPFYLSNNKNESFDMKKVGTPTSGKYLLNWNMWMKGKEYCEITTLTEDSLVLFYEAKPNHIGAEDVYFTYKRIR